VVEKDGFLVSWFHASRIFVIVVPPDGPAAKKNEAMAYTRKLNIMSQGQKSLT
jgi:hypothetical protein